MSRINRKKTRVKTNSITRAGKTENVKAHSIHFMKRQKKDRDSTTEPNCQKWKWKSLSCVRLFATPWMTQSMEFSRQEYWSG